MTIEQPSAGPFSVPADADRLHQPRQVLGNLTITFKVLGSDTGDALLIVENISHGKGGPPRHVHHDQDEWFYAVEGEFVVKIGDETYPLSPGDSVLAPRGVAHVWAHIGDDQGRLLIAFQPAGAMQAFFDEFAQLSAAPPQAEMQRLFRAHGMEITGPPIAV